MNLASPITQMPAAAAFDSIADSYDVSFTHTAIGRAQRNQVWTRLLSAFAPGTRVLELNCGTGEDACFLASRGRAILACDASSEMIRVAKERAHADSSANLDFRQLANEDLTTLHDEKLFDGAFSNFSGLNCLADLRPVALGLANLVKPGGRVLICVWSRLCVTEMLWYLIHGQVRKAIRRLSGEATARLGGVTISVFYPGVREIQSAFAPRFRLTFRRAIGLFVPPSYMESWIARRPALLSRLQRLDEVCSAWPVLRGLGDHVLLEFVRCRS